MTQPDEPDVIVISTGQAGLAVAYEAKRRRLNVNKTPSPRRRISRPASMSATPSMRTMLTINGYPANGIPSRSCWTRRPGLAHLASGDHRSAGTCSPWLA